MSTRVPMRRVSSFRPEIKYSMLRLETPRAKAASVLLYSNFCTRSGSARRLPGLGVPHGVSLDGEQLFFSHVHLHGGPAPVRRYLPELIKLVLDGKINPGKVFDLTLPLGQVAEGYRAMDERRAIKTLLFPNGTK